MRSSRETRLDIAPASRVFGLSFRRMAKVTHTKNTIPRSARKVLTRQDRGVKNRMPASSLVGLGIFSRPIRKANARADLYPRSVKIL